MPSNIERDELHRAIWAIADDLRGSVDGWDFKQYILGVMFYRYISEYLEKYIDKNEHASGNASFAYAKLSDAQAEAIYAKAEAMAKIMDDAGVKDYKKLTKTLYRLLKK